MITNTNEMKTWLCSQYPQEACGVVINEVFYPCTNISPTPLTDFKINGEQIRDLTKQFGHIERIVHTHTQKTFTKDDQGNNIDHRTPSIDDMESSHAFNVPFDIYHCDGDNISTVATYNGSSDRELVGRPYIYGINDCVTLIKDYYWQTKRITLIDKPRPFKWWVVNTKMIETRLTEGGFKRVQLSNINELIPGDVLVFFLMMQYPDHCGTYVGDGKFVHHCFNRLSALDPIEKWYRRIAFVMRKED